MYKKNKTLIKFVNNTGWILFKEVYAMLVSLIVGSLSARYLGPSNYGLINYGGSLISFFLIVTQLGMSNVIILEIVRKPQNVSSYLGTAVYMRFFVSIISVCLIQGIIVCLEPDNNLLHRVTFLQSVSLIFQTSDVLFCWFHAKMEMKYVTLAGIIALTFTSIWRIILLVIKASIEWFALSLSISALISCIMICVFFSVRAKVRLKFHFDVARSILISSYHFIINSVALTFYTQIDKIMIGKALNETVLGYYTAASAISVMWEVIPNAVLNSARPLFVQKYDIDKKEFLRRYQIIILGISVLGVCVGIGFTICAKLLVWILYGSEYYAAVPALKILAWATVCSAIGNIRTTWMVLNNKSKYMEYFTLIGAVINITLNLILIHFWGYIGAALSTFVTSLITGIILPFLFQETKEYAQIFIGSFRQMPNFVELVWNKIKIKNKKR